MIAHTAPLDDPRQAQAGRPRDPGVDRRILAAAYDELVAVGPDRLSLRGVARRAGVSRAALERRWTDPTALALAALARALPPPTIPDLGDLAAELEHAVAALAHSMRAPGLELQMRIVADGPALPAPLHLFQERLLGPGRDQVRAIFERARAREELAADADPAWLADALIGAILMRTTSDRGLRPPHRAELAVLVETFLKLG